MKCITNESALQANIQTKIDCRLKCWAAKSVAQTRMHNYVTC